MRRLPRRKAVAMDTDACSGGQFGADAAVGQRHRIIAGTCLLGRMVEALAIARAGLGGIAGVEPDLSRLRHDEDVAEVRMAGAREMRVAEPLNRRVGIAVARGMVIAVAHPADRK